MIPAHSSRSKRSPAAYRSSRRASTAQSELLSPPSDGLVIDDPHDAASLASAMANMLDRGYLRNASAAARLASMRWTFEQHYQGLLDVFGEVRKFERAA